MGQQDSGRLSRAEQTLRRNLALASRVLSIDGHDDLNQGQVSARLPGQQRFWIKRAMAGFNEAEPDDMICAAVDTAEPPPREAPPELPLHQAIYAERADVNAIVHSHAPHTLVFGATDLPLQPLSHDGACFQGRVARFAQTSQTVLELSVGRAVAHALGAGTVVLMRNHGCLIVGATLREAAVLAQVLERACRLQLLAESSGQPYHVSSAEDVAGKQTYIYGSTSLKSFWDYSVRRVRRLDAEVEQWS